MNQENTPNVTEALGVFSARRDKLIASGMGTANPDNREPYAPFNKNNYVYAKDLRYSVHDASGPWASMQARDPQSLIPCNPFEPSAFRPGGLAVWDAAVCVPACRKPGVKPVRETPVLRSTNKYWESHLTPAINKVGPLGADGAILRPSDPYIVDLTKCGTKGYRIRQAAHALAHMWGDKCDEFKRRASDRTRLANMIADITCEMVFADCYGLPFNTGLRPRRSVVPDFTQYGIDLRSTTQFEAPVMRVDWNRSSAPVPDKTVCVVNVAAFIEPHPYGWTSRTMQYSAKDYWCCTPTIIMIAGWELVDCITHQPLVSPDPTNPASPVGYGIHPLDLQGPDTFWAYMTMAGQARGVPVYTQELREVKEWLFSEDFDHLISTYPALPCDIECMSWNSRADGAPDRPKSMRPFKKGLDKVADHEWAVYDKDRKAIRKLLVEPAVKSYEARFYGTRVEATRRRRAQSDRYKLVREEVRRGRMITRALYKQREGKNLSNDEQRVLAAIATRG